MKKHTILTFLFGLLLFVSAKSNAQTQTETETETGPKWYTNYNEAAQVAKAENKPIMMVFAGSDWCKPCIMLRKEVWDTDAFKQYAQQNLVLVELDFPRFKKNQLPQEQVKHNEEMAAKYNKEGSFPLVVLTKPDGSIIAKTGYQAGGPDKYIPHLQQLLKK
jgi:thioredoxin-related protein